MDGIPAPNPIYKIPIKNVTGNANVKIQNKNLANINEIPSQSGYVSVQIINDTIKIYGNNNPVGYTPLNIKLKQLCPLLKVGDIVILSFKTTSNLYNKNTLYLAGANILWNKDTVKTITESMLDSTVALYGGYNETAVISEFQIELGSTATTYVAHQEQNYPFTFAEGQRGMEGTQLLDDGIHQKRKQIVLDGTQTIELVNWRPREKSVGWIYPYSLTNNKMPSNSSEIPNVFCDKLISKNYGDLYDRADDGIGFATNVYGLVVRIADTSLTTREAINNYLSQNPLLVEYELAESELENNIIPYNETQQAQYDAIKQARSYDDITYITSESDELGFNMNVVAVADANKVIDSLDTRLLALESEV